MNTSSQPPQGLFQDHGFLVIDFLNQPQFPSRCMFTNEPVSKLTKLKINIMKLKGRSLTGMAANAVFNRDVLEIELPISDKWKGQRDAATEWWGKLVWKVGLLAWLPSIVLIGIGIVLASLGPADVVKTPNAYIILPGIICGVVAMIGTLIGAVWPYIEVPTSSAAIDGARLSPPHVWIQNVDSRFLQGLPHFDHSQRSFMDRLFGV